MGILAPGEWPSCKRTEIRQTRLRIWGSGVRIFKTRRPADRAADQIQPGDQPQDRRCARRDDHAAALHLRRRGDRVNHYNPCRSYVAVRESAYGRFCSLIPGFGVKLSAIILAGPTVLTAVGA